MSKYLVYQDVVMKNRALLLRALADCGFDETKIEEGEGLNLVGYHGDERKEKAEIVIRRQYVGSASNDVGFHFDVEKGGYVPIISEYDRGAFQGGRFLVNLKTAYSHGVAREVQRRLRGTSSEYQEGGKTKISVRF